MRAGNLYRGWSKDNALLPEVSEAAIYAVTVHLSLPLALLNPLLFKQPLMEQILFVHEQVGIPPCRSIFLAPYPTGRGISTRQPPIISRSIAWCLGVWRQKTMHLA